MRQELRSGLGLVVLALGLGGAGCATELDSESDSDDVVEEGGDEDVGEGTELIIGGTLAGGTDGHGTVMLFSRTSDTAPWTQLACSGLVLDGRWVMTQAGCLPADLEKYPSRLSVEYQYTGNHVAKEVVRNPGGGQALIRLAEPYAFAPQTARNISALQDVWTPQTPVRCYGFGATSAGGGVTQSARWRDAVVGYSVSGYPYGATEYQIAAGGQQFITYGDGGGPCYDSNDTLLGTLHFDYGGSWMDAAAVARGWEGTARTTHKIALAEPTPPAPPTLCMDVAWGSVGDGAAIQTYYCQDVESQDFRLADLGGGDYQIRPKHSGKCIGVKAGTTPPELIQQTCDRAGANGPSQKFRLQNDGVLYGNVRLIHTQTGLCVDRGAAATPNAIVLKSCDGTGRQKWTLPASPEHDVANHTLSSQYMSGTTCLAPSGVSTSPMTARFCYGNPEEQVTTTPAGNQYHRLQIRSSSMCLDVAAASTADGAIVQQAPCVGGAANQEWKLVRKPTGYEVRARHSNKCLTRDSASPASVTQITCTGYTNQIWNWK